ncbi:MAG: EamA family transporter [Anaerolineales bacterium]|nr:EamA family transporter [Anaerolineales bacterium]
MRLRIAIALLALYLIWGSTYLAIRFAVETLPPFLMAGTRFLVPGLLLVTWRLLAGDPGPTPRQWRATAIVGLLLLLGGNGLVSWAEQRVDSGIAAILVGTTPIWLVLLDALLVSHRRPRWMAIAGLLTGFAGIVLLVGPQNILLGKGNYDLAGIGAVLMAAFLWSVGSIYSRAADLPRSPLLSTGMQMLAGCGGLVLVSLISGEWTGFALETVTSRSWLGLLYLIIFGSLGGFVAYTWLLRHAPISLVSTYAYVNPLVAILLGNWLAQETLDARVLSAAAIIIGSVIVINIARQREAAAARPPGQEEPT